MLLQADLYEQQGLYDHAMQVYKNILSKEPENSEAKERVLRIQETQKMGDTTVRRALTTDNLTPRLALDLGIAYMGMNLFAEALEEFTNAAKSVPGNRAEVMRYSTVCLIRLERFKEARKVLDRVMSDRTLMVSEKGDIVAEALDVYVEMELFGLAGKLLERVPDDLKKFIRDFDKLSAEIMRSTSDEGLELEVEDTETGVVYREPLQDETTTAVKPVATQAPVVRPKPSIPLKTAISYSLDSKKWSDGVSVEVSSEWAVLQVPDPIEMGDSLVLQIHLPSRGDGETVSVISRVAESSMSPPKTDAASVKVQFVSFLPGGEATLRTFIDQAIHDPSHLDNVVKDDSTQAGLGPGDKFSVLQEEAVKALEEDVLTTLPKISTSSEANRAVGTTTAFSTTLQSKMGLDGGARIRFACECGQIHIVPTRNSGRKGKCGNCGQVMTVPAVDTRPDSLTELVVGKIVGGCRLLYKLGGGGMGGVFRGHHIALDIPVAVKILHAHLAEKDPVFIKRFIREARAAAKLQHPNVVGVMNVGFEKWPALHCHAFCGGRWKCCGSPCQTGETAAEQGHGNSN
jgi:hypothetical protein